jgi:molybdate transport system permease protein
MRRPVRLLWALAGLLAIYMIAPFAAGLAQIGAGDWVHADVKGLAHAATISVASATLATFLIALGGIPLGYLLARVPGRRVQALGFVVQLPLALPPLSSGVLLLFLLGYASPLGRLTHGALTDSFTGIVLAQVFVAAPFLIIAARSAFASVDPLLEDVAASLGHGPAAVFRRVSLALAWPTILAGLLLAWLRAFGEFGATVMVAYHPFSLPVFTYVAFGSEGLPAMAPILLMTVMAAVVVMGLSLAARRLDAEPAPRHDAPAPLNPQSAAPLKGDLSPQGPHLSIRGRRRLQGFDLTVDWQTSARRLAILGASGSGKSLTLRLIAGLGETEGSEVLVSDRDLGRRAPQARGVAYVPQSYGLMPHLNVAAQIRFAIDADPTRAQHWTHRLALDGLQSRKPHELSLGQQQRVALARALARPSTQLLLLDEPFAALDTPLRARLRQELLGLQGEMNLTTILVTHDPIEAMLLANEILLLDAGRVLQSGPISAVFARPVNEAAARLLGADLIGRGRVTADGRIDIGGGVRLRVDGPALTSGADVGWAVRPHQIRWREDGDYPALILHRTPTVAGQCRVKIRLGGLELDLPADPSCPPHGPCRLAIDPAAVQVWTLT